MNKSELVAAVAAKAEVSKVAAAKAVDAVLESIIESVKKEENVQLIGFGTFSVVNKPAREGVNPRNGQKVTIAAKKVVKFKAGAKLAF